MRINNVTPKNQNQTAFKGKFPTAAMKDALDKWNYRELFEPGRQGNMTRHLFTLNAFIFLLGGRLIKSRDNNEKRETLTRDIPTILLAVYGVPKFENFLAKRTQDRSGFAILNNYPVLKDGIIDAEQTKDWYVLDKNLNSNKKGLETFLTRLSEKQANLKKVVSTLGDDIKEGIKQFSDDNAKFMQELLGNSSMKAKVQEGFLNETNAAFKKASFAKTAPKLVGIAITTGLIGMFLPHLNIVITELVNRRKNKNAQPPANEAPKVEQSKPQYAFQAMKPVNETASEKAKKTFASFMGNKN